ncbi:MAG TPA: hypothetical protein VIL20_09075 [Sandaracinaceae bacterium]
MTRRIALLSIVLAACGQTGSLAVTVSGEEAAVSGFDASAFADGWAVRFDALVVSLRDFELHGADGVDAALASDPVLVDLHRGDALAWSFEGVPARRWEDVRFRIAPATDEARDVGELDPALRARMIDEGLSILVIGKGEREGVTRDFELAFTLDVTSSRCEGADRTDGIVVSPGARRETQITLHWDHLFFDSLAVEEARMRFEAIAAASDGSAPITLEDLSAQRLADLRGMDGGPLTDESGAPIVYDPGSTPLAAPTLRGMIEAAAVTVGHLDGEGHCEYERR